MTAIPNYQTDNVIQLKVLDGKLGKKQEVRYNKDGTVDKRKCNKMSGVSSEVYGFTDEEVEMIVSVLDKHINEATTENKKWVANRNKMLFLIGINVGLRASDLCNLKFEFFMKDDKTFKNTDNEPLKLKPKKTKKLNKFVPVHINQIVKDAITNYINEYPIEKMDDYLFKSKKGDGAITERSLWRIIVDLADECGIEKNVGSHSLRKTFGHRAFNNAEDKNKVLIELQSIFNHNSPQTTMAYIGLLNSDIKNVFISLERGLDYL